MTNRNMDAKDVYFRIIGYDIGMYRKHSQDLSRKSKHGKRTWNMNGDINTSDGEEGGSRNAPRTAGQPKMSQQ